MVYLEPREQFDNAIDPKEDGVVYLLSKIIDLLIEDDMDHRTAMEYYCFNIQPLIQVGLDVMDDISMEEHSSEEELWREEDSSEES